MNPIEGRVGFCVEAFGFQNLDAAVGSLDVRVELVVGVLRRVDIRHRTLVGFGICCDLDFVA